MPATEIIEQKTREGIKAILLQKTLSPGEPTEVIDTPAGPIQVFGTTRGFVVRRIGTGGIGAAGIPDIEYSSGETFTLHQPKGKDIIFEAYEPDNWEASPTLDSTA